jgi:hypothetical protein
MEKHEQRLFSHSCLLHIFLFIYLYFSSTHNGLFLLIENFVSGNKCRFLIRFWSFFCRPRNAASGHHYVHEPAYSLYRLYPGSYSSNQITCYMNSLQLHHTAVVGTAWSAARLASERPGRVIHFSKTFHPTGRTFSPLTLSPFGDGLFFKC